MDINMNKESMIFQVDLPNSLIFTLNLSTNCNIVALWSFSCISRNNETITLA